MGNMYKINLLFKKGRDDSLLQFLKEESARGYGTPYIRIIRKAMRDYMEKHRNPENNK